MYTATCIKTVSALQRIKIYHNIQKRFYYYDREVYGYRLPREFQIPDCKGKKKFMVKTFVLAATLKR